MTTVGMLMDTTRLFRSFLASPETMLASSPMASLNSSAPQGYRVPLKASTTLAAVSAGRLSATAPATSPDRVTIPVTS